MTLQKENTLIKLVYQWCEHLKSQQILQTELIQHGWYPNSIMSRHQKLENESIDDFMIRSLTGR